MKWDAGSSRAGPIPSACQALTDGYLHYDLHYIHCDTEHGPRSLVGAGQLDLTDYARQTCAALNEFLIACNLHKYYTTWFPYLKLLNWTCLILDELCAWALAISDWQRSLVITIILEFCFICRRFNNKYITVTRWTLFIRGRGFARVKIAFRLVRQDIWRAEIDFILNTSYSMYRWRNTQIFRTAL